MPHLAKREFMVSVVVPRCVSVCIIRGDTSACPGTGITDVSCLCRSKSFITGVLTCWNQLCTLTEIQQGLAYTSVSCAGVGIQINPQDYTGAVAPATVNIDTPPMLYYPFSGATTTIQIVFSTLCSFILLASLVMGILSCRAQARREAAFKSPTSATFDTYKSRPSRFGFSSRRGDRSDGRFTQSTVDFGSRIEFDPTDSFHPSRYGARGEAVRDVDYGIRNTFSPTGSFTGSGGYAAYSGFGNERKEPRFTNRLNAAERVILEEYEMETTPSPTAASGSGSGSQGDETEKGDGKKKVDGATASVRSVGSDSDSNPEHNVVVIRKDSVSSPRPLPPLPLPPRQWPNDALSNAPSSPTSTQFGAESTAASTQFGADSTTALNPGKHR